jgi:hypothetical protein
MGAEIRVLIEGVILDGVYFAAGSGYLRPVLEVVGTG